jgi:methyl-accepting chemotaxis protein
VKPHRLPIDVKDLDVRRPLDSFPSIKLKLGFVIAAAVAGTILVFWLGIKIGVWPSVSGIIAGLVAMAIVWFLARGMTSPLREMAAAAGAMAKGDYTRRVTATSHDEVGALARTFNEMAAQLGETDRVRRDLVANVSRSRSSRCSSTRCANSASTNLRSTWPSTWSRPG